MRDFLILLLHLMVTLARLAGPGGLRSVVAESVVGSASGAGPQSRSQTCSQSANRRSDHHGIVHAFHPPGTCPAFRYCSEACHAAAFSQPAEQTKVPNFVFAQTPPTAWPKGTGHGTHRCRRCNETAQP